VPFSVTLLPLMTTSASIWSAQRPDDDLEARDPLMYALVGEMILMTIKNAFLISKFLPL